MARAEDLHGDDVAALPPADREAVLDYLRAELESDPEHEGHWCLVEADVETCEKCLGAGHFTGFCVSGDGYEYHEEEGCEDCDGVGYFRARPTMQTEADYECGMSPQWEQLIASGLPLKVLLEKAAMPVSTVETVRPGAGDAKGAA